MDRSSEPERTEDQLAVALRQLVGDRNIRRYLCLHHPEELHRAQHALEAWDAGHPPVGVNLTG